MKRLQVLKGFICGFLAAIVLLISIPALAASIDVIFNPLNIVINGVKAASKGENYTLANGNEVPFSIVYKGTTYLPLRKLSELMGKELKLDSTTDTVYLNDPVVTYDPKEEFPEKEEKGVSEQQYLTRAELARFLVQSLDLKDDGTVPEFSDVPPTHEYYEDIKITFQHGIIKYTVPRNISPSDPINKQQYSVYLCRALKIDMSEDYQAFTKINDIEYLVIGAQKSLQRLVDLGIMKLDENGNINPYEYLSSPLTPNPNLKNYIQE